MVRNVAFFRGHEDAETETHTTQQQLDAPVGREQYRQRFATVEPVFANVRYNKRLDRFTLRGRTKVHGRWLLFCLVRYIEKLTHAGCAPYITRRKGRTRSRLTPASRESLGENSCKLPLFRSPEYSIRPGNAVRGKPRQLRCTGISGTT